MRFVAVQSKAQQAALMLHKARDLLVRQRMMLINALRGHLGEYGIIAAQGAAFASSKSDCMIVLGVVALANFSAGNI